MLNIKGDMICIKGGYDRYKGEGYVRYKGGIC